MEIWWILLIIVAVAALISAMLAVSNYGAERFLALHEEMSATQANAHMSVLEFITDVNLEKLEGKLKIARTDKKLGDGYASKSKTLVITDETLRGVSIASFSIAAHELGHAIQDHEGNLLKHKNRLKRAGWVFGKLFLPCILVCLVMLFFPQYQVISIIFGSLAGGIFLLSGILKMLTIYIERDASKRAIKLLDVFLPNSDMKLVKKYLKGARLTYWSDFMKLLFGWSGLTRKTKMFK